MKKAADASGELQELRKIASNKRCFDCNQAGTTYAIPELGIFLCSICGGIHREFNHRVKGLSTCNFNEAEVSKLKSMGNEKAATIWMARHDPRTFPVPDLKDSNKLKDFLKLKYLDKRFYENREASVPVPVAVKVEIKPEVKVEKPQNVGFMNLLEDEPPVSEVKVSNSVNLPPPNPTNYFPTTFNPPPPPVYPTNLFPNPSVPNTLNGPQSVPSQNLPVPSQNLPSPNLNSIIPPNPVIPISNNPPPQFSQPPGYPNPGQNLFQPTNFPNPNYSNPNLFQNPNVFQNPNANLYQNPMPNGFQNTNPNLYQNPNGYPQAYPPYQGFPGNYPSGLTQFPQGFQYSNYANPPNNSPPRVPTSQPAFFAKPVDPFDSILEEEMERKIVQQNKVNIPPAQQLLIQQYNVQAQIYQNTHGMPYPYTFQQWVALNNQPIQHEPKAHSKNPFDLFT